MPRCRWCTPLTLMLGWILASPFAAGGELDVLVRRSKVRFDDVPRKVLAFYYPWYGNPEVAGASGQWSHWKGVDREAKQIDTSTHYPKLGPYDSHDPHSVAQHSAWAKQAGIDGWIVSWWGHKSFSDRAMDRILQSAHAAGLDVTIYYETVPNPKTPDTAAADIVALLKRYGEHPAWLRVDGKPVVFVYGRAVGELGLIDWAEAVSRINKQYAAGAVVIGDRISRTAAAVFDGIHTYNTAGRLKDKSPDDAQAWARETFPDWVRTADAFGRISTLTVIPGYDDTKIRSPGLNVPRDGGRLYRTQWQEAIAADPHWVLITSWNEWHEGSEIEPSHEDGDQYLQITGEYTARFKALGERTARPAEPDASERPSPKTLDRLNRLAGTPIGVLPEPGMEVLWSLLKMPMEPKLLSWQQVTEFDAATPDELPVLVYASDEPYRRTVRQRGDVDAGLLRYLKAGGLMVVVPSGPMPFHYDQDHRVVGGNRTFGLPLSVGGKEGGWEEPPAGVDLRFVQPDRRLPSLPESFPFPAEGDLRWRPFVRSALAEGDLMIPLLELRDAEAKHYGDAAAYVERRISEPRGARLAYAWFGLFDTPHAERLLSDVFAFVAERFEAP